jgi:hypothetical protein
MQESNYKHNFAAHCETGVINSLFENNNLKLTEPMSFGVGSGLFFLFVPFFKVMGNPITSYRSLPGSIFKKCCKRLGVKFVSKRFRSQIKGVRFLDALLTKGIYVGIQTNIYWLPYIPKNFRFHFNAHNLIVIGKEKNTYTVSDPLIEELAECPSGPLNKARFSKGPLAPKGFLYYLESDQELKETEKAIYKGIKETVRRMLYTPVPIAGVRGIRFLSKYIRKWFRKLDDKQAKLYLASVVRMQEEIGTGGAGFRYIYASFLDEAGTLINNSVLTEASKEMEHIADQWRSFATKAVKLCKDKPGASLEEVVESLDKIAVLEYAFYKNLEKRYL